MTMRPETAKDLDRLRRLATRMDSAVKLPVIGVRVGWDALLGLVPGIGDALALAPSLYIMKEAHRMGTPRSTLMRMGVNSGIDLAIGAIPVLGDVFDIGWRSKTRNVDLLEQHLTREAAKKGPANAAPSQNQSGRLQPTSSSPEKK